MPPPPPTPPAPSKSSQVLPWPNPFVAATPQGKSPVVLIDPEHMAVTYKRNSPIAWSSSEGRGNSPALAHSHADPQASAPAHAHSRHGADSAEHPGLAVLPPFSHQDVPLQVWSGTGHAPEGDPPRLYPSLAGDLTQCLLGPPAIPTPVPVLID